MDFWFKDPRSGLNSASLTFLVWGFVLASFKLLFSDTMIYGVKFSSFTGADFALVLASVGSLYGLRKHQSKGDSSEKAS